MEFRRVLFRSHYFGPDVFVIPSDATLDHLPDEVAVDHLHDAREDGQFGRSDDPDVVEHFREIGPGGYVRRSATRESGKDLPSADLMVHRREGDAEHRGLGLYRSSEGGRGGKEWGRLSGFHGSAYTYTKKQKRSR